MQQNPLNIVVFDEEQSFRTEQSRVQLSKQASQELFNQSNLIQNELTILTQKIQNLQRQSSKLQDNMKVKSQTNISDTTQISGNTTQCQQLLKLIEKKIKIIVRQTKLMIEKLTNDIDKKLNQNGKDKNHQRNTIMKIQNHCRETIMKIQSKYEKDIEKVIQQHRSLESQMIKKVEEMQGMYQQKLSQFKAKQSQYIGTIDHLQGKLRNVQKNKKMIEVTQEKPIGNSNCNILENISGVSNNQHISGLPPNDTSKRRTKIFDKSPNRSVSPNNQVLSPTAKIPPQPPSHQTQSLARPVVPSNQEKNKVFFYSKYSQNKQSKYEEPIHCEIPSVQKRQIIESSKSSKPSKQIRQIESSSQFYKDVPKANWERFQDYDENGSSGSEQDVFFYPEHNRQEKSQPKAVFEYQNDNQKEEERMYSPFDIK